MSRDVRFIKKAARGRHGAVAAKNQLAADIGAKVLSGGGNAVDACIATALVLGVLEPWTSGLGSSGCMTIWDHDKHRGVVIDFPAALPGQRHEVDFRWPGETDGNRAAAGAAARYRAIAVPGLPDGLWAAHLFASKPWTELVAPAVEVSEEGLEFDWYVRLVVGLAAADLARFPDSRNWLLPDDLPAPSFAAKLKVRLRNPALTATLKLLAERGARDFYEGFIAYTLHEDLRGGGSRITKADLQNYRAQVVEPEIFPRGSKRYLLPPVGAMAESFRNLLKYEGKPPAQLDSKSMTDLAHAFAATYAEARRPGAPVYEWSSHVSVIDGGGNMASLSQSLGSPFGSRIVLSNTGILANDYGAESEADPGSRKSGGFVAHKLLPIVGLSGERPWLALGVAGDRHILPTLVQLISLVDDLGYSLEDAFHHPRIGICESGRVQIDATAPDDIKTAMTQIFHAEEVPAIVQPFKRPCAVAVGVDPFSGERLAITEVTELWSGAAAIA